MKVERFVFNMFSENCYVLSDETNEAVIIDAGCYFPEEQQQLRDYLIGNKLNVKELICTHLHLDHVFGNPFLLREFGLKAKGSESDVFLLSKLPDQCRKFGFKENESPVALGRYIEGGSVVRFGKTELKVISLPGHSPGGLAFYCEKEHCLFSGDSLFRGSIGRTDLEGGDMKSLYRSIVHHLFVLPDDVIVYPGHGEPTSIGYEKKNNPYFHMNDK